MNAPRLTFLNKLQDRGLVDQWGFAFFSAVGSIGIVIAKALDVRAGIVAVCAVAIMLAYAALISRFGSGRLRSDQAGDNCYYLGLIYTLASLAYTIFTFDPANTATTIVQGFGIALATTILGLVLRVVFNQGRPDLEEVESGARRDLVDAVSRLKTELGQTVIAMNDFGIQVRQSISETQDSATKDIAKFAEIAVTRLGEVADKSHTVLQTETSEFASRSKRQLAAVDRLVASLEKHGDRIDRVTETHDRLGAIVHEIGESVSSAQQATSNLAAQSESLVASINGVRDSSELTRQTLEQLARTATDVQSSVSGFHTEVNEQLKQLRSGPGEAIAEASQSLVRASTGIREELEALRKLQRDATSSLLDQSGSVAEAFRRHNEALELELTRSRQQVEKVHANLVEMTSELVRQVEARR